MGRIKLSPLLHESLILVGRFASKLTISDSGICSESIQVELKDVCDCTFTIRVKDLSAMLKNTQDFILGQNELRYNYCISGNNSLIKVERTVRVYNEVYQIEGGVPLLSIAVSGLKILSKDDHEIRADSDGNLLIQSFGTVETRTEHTGLRVIENAAKSAHARVRAKDLYVLEKLPGDIVLSFLESHVLAYSLRSDSTVIVQIKMLNE